MKPTGRTSSVLTHFAGRAGDHNDRAMRGSRVIAAGLSTRLGAAPVVVGTAQPALCVNWDDELRAARPALQAMAEQYEKILGAGGTPITAMGRCAVALATLPRVAAHRPDAVVVWLDAHPDLNTPAGTASGYLGGMALSGPLGWWDSGFGQGLSPERVVLVGARDIDPPEQSMIDTTGIVVVPAGPDAATELAAVLAGRPAYVHLDCDVLAPGIVPTDYRVPGGLTLPDLRAVAAVIARHPVAGIEIAEFETDREQVSPRPLLDALQPLIDKVQARSDDGGGRHSP
jgi:arginase